MFIAFRTPFEPVPCSQLLAKGQHCGKPSQAAEVESFLDADGSYVLQPICRECAQRLADLYSELPPVAEKPAALDLDTIRQTLAARLGLEGAEELVKELQASAQE